MPPALRTLKSKQVISMSANRNWKHPPASAGYSSQELADFIGFLKRAAAGERKEVRVAEVEGLQ
ncbi:MAG: hypothetical protein EXQ52_14965 [Bryobacterales bacterium]|nr:hypothetical protein [Bryobacterales bacterium]